jgi:hypothetical protein
MKNKKASLNSEIQRYKNNHPSNQKRWSMLFHLVEHFERSRKLKKPWM